MPDRKLRLAIIGCGAIVGNNHFPAIKNSRDWQISFLVDHDRERIKSYAEQFECGYSVSAADIPADVDACLIATPNFLHASQSIEALEKGHHVICEKPMALTLEDAMRVKKTADKNNRQFFLVHQKRYMPNLEFFRSWSRAGGDVQNVDISLGAKFTWASKTGFYESADKAGGGAIIDLGVHLFDILVSLWGEVQVKKAFLSAPGSAFPVIDAAATCLGTVGKEIPLTVRVSRASLLNNSLRIHTSSQFLELFLDGNRFSLAGKNTGGRGCRVELPGSADHFVLYWNAVAKCIRGEAVDILPSQAEDGIKVMQCIEDLRNAAEFIN